MYKGLELDLLHEEVKELRLEVTRLHVKEDNMEQEVRRHRRQVDLFSRPEVLDYAYNSRMPDSSSELSVYDKWFTGKENKKDRLGKNCFIGTYEDTNSKSFQCQKQFLPHFNSPCPRPHSLDVKLGRSKLLCLETN